jgi:crotonobetainyl-CoA:carnitine CoA-transferase CaiB-like acyl-CoA transferase
MDKDQYYKHARKDLTGPLCGVKVVEATTTWAGPMAACVLADFGAHVIKVEHPAGEVARILPPAIPNSSLTVANETVNRNKESLSLELHTASGREILLKLIAEADIFIENFRPGTMAKWGLGYDDLKAVKADIVYVSISGFGQFGPLSDRVGYDPLAQNYSGWAAMNGDPEGGPTKAPTFLGDDLAGLHGALGAMAALRHRDQNGEGQHVDVALVDAIVFQSNGLATSGALGIDLPRMGNEFAIAAPVNNYTCTNGAVFAGVLLDTHWKVLANELEREDLADLNALQRIQQRALVDDVLAQYCAVRTTEAVVKRFAELGLPATRVNRPEELANEPHITARDMLLDTQLSSGQIIPLVGPAVKFSRTPTRIRQSAPVLGQHNHKILADLGFSESEIKKLETEGVISS